MSTAFGAAWLMEQEFPPTKYVVPGIVPEGMTLLVAAPKIGKSWMALGLGLDLSNGGNAFGCLPIDRPRPVLYLALEDGQRRLQSRMRQINPAVISDMLEFQTSIDNGNVITTIRDYLALHDGSDPCVILDTLGKVMPEAQGNATQYGHDYRMLSALKGTTDAVPGSSLIIVHHTRKSVSGDFLDAVSGTQGIAGAADTVLVLKRERQEKKATLMVTSRDAEEGEYALTFTDAGVWELDGHDLKSASQAAQTARATDGVGDRMAEVILTIARFPEGIKRSDLEVLHPEISNMGEYLSRALKSGRIEKLTRGLYGPVTTGTSVTFHGESPTNHVNHTLLGALQ